MVKEQTLKSAIYTGQLAHCRHRPKYHFFRYRVFMMYLDLSEIPQVFSLSSLWSHRRFSLAWLKRADYIGPIEMSIEDAVRKRIYEETGEHFNGPVRMLTNLRYFGFSMNPITSYYCFDSMEKLRYIVAEVTNTPWNERHAYVLPCNPDSSTQRIEFRKALHVSPFNDMQVDYAWKSNLPAQQLRLSLENWRDGEKDFDANLSLQRKEISASSLRRLILGYPFMTIKVGLAIYWQALRLYIKGVKPVRHPSATGKDDNKLSSDFRK